MVIQNYAPLEDEVLEPPPELEEPDYLMNGHDKPSKNGIAQLVAKVIEDNDALKVYGLKSALARVSAVECEEHITQLQEHFGRRIRVASLRTAIKEAHKARKRAILNARKNPKEGRPVVEVGGQLRDVVKAALDALARANKDESSIFVQSGRLVEVQFSEKKGPAVTTLSLSRLRYRMSLSADYISVRGDNAVPVDPPLEVVRVLLEGMSPIDYPFSPLIGITQLPIPRPDGSICQTPGYDVVTQQFYAPGELTIPPIPDRPSSDDVQAALALLQYWMAGFPFADEASRAAALAAAITIVLRSLINGQVPLVLMDAPKQGSGKTILAQAIGILGTGRAPSPNAPVTEEAEWIKSVLTWLQTSPAIVLIDNLIHPLESSALNSALTSSTVQGRELGSNTLLDVPNRAVWFACGNNIRVGDDTARRCIKCRLDAKMERPHTRKGFQIPGGVNGFFRWTEEHRAELVAAILTLARNWYALGRPEPDVTPIGNFEEWTVIVGGILQAAGVPGFLANLDDADGASAIDEVTAEWQAFVSVVRDAYRGVPFTCSELAKRMLVDDSQAEALREALPTSLSRNFDNYQKSQGRDRDFATHIGHAFRVRKGQVFGSLCLEVAGKGRANKVQWQVSGLGQEDGPQDDLGQTVPESALPPKHIAMCGMCETTNWVLGKNEFGDPKWVCGTCKERKVPEEPAWIKEDQACFAGRVSPGPALPPEPELQKFVSALNSPRYKDMMKFFARGRPDSGKSGYMQRQEYIDLVCECFRSEEPTRREWAMHEIDDRAK